MHYNRFTGNSAPSGTAVHTGATTDATENWWGCNTGPGTAGCDTLAGTVTVEPPPRPDRDRQPAHVVGPNGTATHDRLAAHRLHRRRGVRSQPGAFAALPVTFSDPPGDATVTLAAGAHTANISAPASRASTTTRTRPRSARTDQRDLRQRHRDNLGEVDQSPAITSPNTAHFNVGQAG